nr:MAG TPA: hypothetical protein [Caudoviricetes sp.]
MVRLFAFRFLQPLQQDCCACFGLLHVLSLSLFVARIIRRLIFGFYYIGAIWI